MMRKLTFKRSRNNTERDARIVSEHLGGLAYKQLAWKHGLCVESIRQICKKGGVPPKRRR